MPPAVAATLLVPLFVLFVIAVVRRRRRIRLALGVLLFLRGLRRA
jgi:MYXO-CTERM domain-containing protein